MSRRVLVIEDDRDILELITYNLERDGYEVSGVTSGEDGLHAAKLERPDVVLLDLMLPGIDGLEVCRRLKSDPDAAHLPIIIVTAKGEESDIVAGLELGADDYVTKPFSPKVLVARIRAVQRRRERALVKEDAILKIGDMVIHPGRHEVTAAGACVDLTFTEFRILHILARRPGWVYTRRQIVSAIHGTTYPVTERAIDVQIVSLRRKLGDGGALIETVRGVGYRLKD